MRVALILDVDGGFPKICTDSPDVEIYSISDATPNDRVYLMGPSITRMSLDAFDMLIAGPLHRLGDKPIVEQAIRAKLDLNTAGKPSLSLVQPDQD